MKRYRYNKKTKKMDVFENNFDNYLYSIQTKEQKNKRNLKTAIVILSIILFSLIIFTLMN